MGKLVVVGIIAIILLIAGCGSYNSLVTSEETVNEAWSQVENQYQRRADLIPNLVATVKGYAAHESNVLTRVTEARARATGITVDSKVLEDPQAFQRFEAAQNELSQALRQLLMVTENYPNLKADQQFLALQSQLEGTENRIATERRRFNSVVQQYNTKVRRFPAAIFAGLFGFEEKQYFKSAPGSDKVPEVKF
ncbi:MAG: LemA family protein [bacterium]|nr:LemA family protein [Candidatus Kapabacteria bacterium]